MDFRTNMTQNQDSHSFSSLLLKTSLLKCCVKHSSFPWNCEQELFFGGKVGVLTVINELLLFESVS